jgi:hypothetical protein
MNKAVALIAVKGYRIEVREMLLDPFIGKYEYQIFNSYNALDSASWGYDTIAETLEKIGKFIEQIESS